MTIELVPLATATVTLAEPFVLVATPAGTRVIAETTAYDLDGDRLRGHLAGNAAADWLVVDGRGQGTLDVRALIETHDGALVFVSYRGRLDLANGPGSAPVYAAPLFETGDERYLWLNAIQAVAKGTMPDASTLVYEIYEMR
jgi:hypothetical protein